MKVRRGDIVYLNTEILKRHHIQGGNRPWIVVSNDCGNYHSEICMLVPMTTNRKKLKQPTHMRISYGKSMALCEQIMTMWQGNIERVAGRIGEREQKMLQNCLCVALGIPLLDGGHR